MSEGEAVTRMMLRAAGPAAHSFSSCRRVLRRSPLYRRVHEATSLLYRVLKMLTAYWKSPLQLGGTHANYTGGRSGMGPLAELPAAAAIRSTLCFL